MTLVIRSSDWLEDDPPFSGAWPRRPAAGHPWDDDGWILAAGLAARVAIVEELRQRFDVIDRRIRDWPAGE